MIEHETGYPLAESISLIDAFILVIKKHQAVVGIPPGRDGDGNAQVQVNIGPSAQIVLGLLGNMGRVYLPDQLRHDIAWKPLIIW
ncbi:MAG TPA: hypothetical protein VFX43_03625 [Chitinophagaceae bacterium]|nr:hypothetical protein [Chitinophagaceae bacterium]